MAQETVRVTLWVSGDVQGVGFRWWTQMKAGELGLVGSARNLGDGRVEVTAQGSREAVDQLHELLAERPSTARRPGRVESVRTLPGDPDPSLRRFDVR